jgi:hypothetical protein
MRTLFDADTRAEILDRLGRLRPDATRSWGTLSAPQVVIHCVDTFDHTFGIKDVEPPNAFVQSALVRWFVIDSPLPWPKGVRSVSQYFESEPHEFGEDLAKLRSCVERFAQGASGGAWGRSPMLGRLSPDQWARLQYRHLDHHLRQFGL